METVALGLQAAHKQFTGGKSRHLALASAAGAPRYLSYLERSRAPVIARLLGLCLLVLAAVPASADVRLEGPAPSSGKTTPAPGVGHVLPRPAGPDDLDQSEREPPVDQAVAVGSADTDQPERVAVPLATSDQVPALRAGRTAQAQPVRAPPSHRA